MTTRLVEQINKLLEKYPDKQVLLITQKPSIAAKEYLNLMDIEEIPLNLGFINYSYFLDKKKTLENYIAFIDDLNLWLEEFNIVGYTNIVGDTYE